jgi:hypothetical protein
MNGEFDSDMIGGREPQLEKQDEPNIATLVVRSAANVRVDGVGNTEDKATERAYHSIRRTGYSKSVPLMTGEARWSRFSVVSILRPK